MFDTAAQLRPRIVDRAGVWDFLRLFAAAWGLSGTGRSFRGPMPAALREAYALGTVLDRAGPQTEDGVLIFHWADSQITDTCWGVPLDHLDGDDPPVVVNTGGGWQPYVDRVSLACVDIALTTVVQEHDEKLCNAAELPAALVGPALAGFDRVPLPDLPMWIDVEESPVRWYSGPGQLLRTHGEGGVWLWVSAQSDTALSGLYAAMPGARDHWSN
ncbi:hypothetical protein [Actinoplanes xinjiangensis]|uniref:Uncharacterized protein n=1 Tax=Actinoplanes xinjiangensis TaxID=512350 RepID=A0A316F7N5_9ACTN|nr:hypothetical protein [Actinoplanes xinjiangensis]PWK40111.1 hypothetical protein BC793_12050 [Actinoplanes xinjiangensis]GIF42426.1 hypothetical protein Axi01nite_67370 [Actinoplanes xinjiangensis]